MNRFGHTIFYVADVQKTVEFYEKAFGIPRQFIDETGHYAQMDTGSTVLGFASFTLAKQNLKKEFRAINAKEPIVGCEISFLTTDLKKSLATALKAGAELIAPAEAKPWGQTIAYLRDFNGILIEIGTEMEAHCETEGKEGSCGCC
jgi:catechol 2,3-dioxygenase-like lactoylglutathione lyase family enzyme